MLVILNSGCGISRKQNKQTKNKQKQNKTKQNHSAQAPRIEAISHLQKYF